MDLLERLPTDVPIFLGGFSMGGGLALQMLRKIHETYLSSTDADKIPHEKMRMQWSVLQRVRGVFAIGSFAVESSALFSTYPSLCHRSHDETAHSASSSSTSSESKVNKEVDPRRPHVLMLHGESDSKIQPSWASATAYDLHLRDLDVMYQTYPGVDHDLTETEVRSNLSA